MNIIPIVFAFNHRVVMPAGVCFTALLKAAKSDTFYDIFVLHGTGDLDLEYQEQLTALQRDFKNCKFSRRVRIAVLDNSFFGYQTEVGERLPAGTQYFPGVKSDADRFEDKSMHGLFMAILIHQIVLKSG